MRTPTLSFKMTNRPIMRSVNRIFEIPGIKDNGNLEFQRKFACLLSKMKLFIGREGDELEYLGNELR